MRLSGVLTGVAALSALAFSAEAHPSPNILQAGAAKSERVSYTGVIYTRENNVDVYRGRKMLLGAPAREKAPRSDDARKIIVSVRPCRNPPARLRTQGFYSGRGWSHPFTQGFYSGQRRAQ